MSTFSTLYDNGTYGYMGIGPMPAQNIRMTISAPSGSDFYCGDSTYWGICAYDPNDRTRYALLRANPLHEVYYFGSDEHFIVSSTTTSVPSSVTVDIPASASQWEFHGGMKSVEGCALCLITFIGSGGGTMSSGSSPCGSDYAAISGDQKSWFSYEINTVRYANSIDGCPIFAERSTKDANGDQIDTTYLKSADATSVKKTTASLPPVSTRLSELEIFTDGRIRGDSSDMGLLVPYPAQADSGKILQANWSGSPAIGRAMWVDKPSVVDYIAGTGLSSSVDKQTGDVTFTWAYTVGRNLTVNPNGHICTAIPGTVGDASTAIDAIFHPVTNGEFAGAYVLMTRKNADSTYDIGIRYIASGTSSTISFVGTETVIANDGTITVNPAVYMNQKVTYSGNKFGTTTFNPSTHKAIYYSGLAMIGPISDTKIAIFKDAGDHVKVAFTSMEAKIAW